MQIKIVTGATAYEAAINAIKQIDVKNFEQENLVVVPDAFSMQAETLIFDVLNIKSTFNIQVVGVSKLISQILRNNNLPFERISGLEEIFCIFKAVTKNLENFVYFRSASVDFCLKVLQIVKQFKSCKILPEQIKMVKDELLNKKMHDLKLIYSSYNTYLGEKFDLSKMFDYFCENAQNCANLSKMNLYFVNFDSFSAEISNVIMRLCQFVGSVCVGMAKPASLGNAFIYENDIYNKLLALSKEFDVTIDVENFSTQIPEPTLTMVKNLFSFNVKNGKNDFFLKALCTGRQDEIEFVAKYIKYAIAQGAKFKDFSVAVPSEQYYPLIRSVFEKFDIAYYTDDATSLQDTIVGRNIMKFLQICRLGWNKQNFQFLINSPFFTDENYGQIMEEIFYQNIEKKEEFFDKFPQFSQIFALSEQISSCKNVSNFVSVLKSFLALLQPKFESVLQEFCEEDEKKRSENHQSFQLIVGVLSKLNEIASEEEISLADFERLLSLALKSVKVETIPNYVDAVYVANATDSYFADVANLFVLGATAGALPKTQADTAIIDDDDIKKLKLNFALEPEIKVINRRNRLKVFEMLQHARKKLIVCVPKVEDGKQTQQAGFVSDLCKMFGDNFINTSSLAQLDTADLNEKQRLNRLLFNLGCQENVVDAFTKLKSENNLPMKYELALSKFVSKNFERNKKCSHLPQETAKNLAFSKNRVSASQLETYFHCPFKHFMQYEMKIKQRENILPNKRMFGVFEHALLQKFVENFGKNLAKVDGVQIDKFLNENLMSEAEKVYEDKALSNRAFVKYLFKESKIILKNVVYEQQNSLFKPTFLECKITQKMTADLELIGFIDRVDEKEDFFRIIDYKTGSTKTIKKDLFYGRKLQLFLYANAMKEKLNHECGGVYYFDCQTKYQKKGSSHLLFNGITKKDERVLEFADKRILDNDFKSDLIGVAFKKTAKKGEFAYKGGNLLEDFDPLFDYAQKVSVGAIEEIEEGFIKDKPAASDCEYCPYKSVCLHTEADGFRKLQQIKDENFKGKKSED